jgi:hypothetical protein
MVSLATLVKELKTLRKGRGVFTGDIHRRVGPGLRAACEVTENDGPGEIRRKVAARLENFAADLPPDLCTAITVGFALGTETRFPHYEDRVERVAQELRCLPRTARRRIDEGVQHIAELIAESLARTEYSAQAISWHTTELCVEVALDGPGPEIVEHRRVVSHRDHLTELDLAVTLASAGGHPEVRQDDLRVDVVYGGTLAKQRMESSERVGFVLVPPSPLARGEAHVFACQYSFAGERGLRQHLVCVPRYPCDLFDLRVRFGAAHRVWLVHGTFQRDVDDHRSPGEELPVDPAGEVHVRFRDLSPGLAYGLRWARTDGGGRLD